MCFKNMRKKQKGFSLVELLVVIGIISVLAAMIMPAFSAARERARRANCRSNLRQMGSAIEIYEQNQGLKPPFLSALYPEHLPEAIYVCHSDPYEGMAGSKPPWGDESRFPETNELSEDTDYGAEFGIDKNRANRAGESGWESEVYGRDGYQVSFDGSEPKEPHNFRNTDIEGSSYIYEFSTAQVPPGDPSDSDDYWTQYDDEIRGDITTWHDFKVKEVGKLGTKTPMVRCYYHTTTEFRGDDLLLNLGYHHGVYGSGVTDPAWHE